MKTRPDAQLLQTVMLRSLRQAVYSPDNVGHFGLAYEAYTHFTSPIRRYPDLLVHRAIKATLAGERLAHDDWDAIGLHCSMTERRADDATRDVVAWLKCYYMQDKVGEQYWGSVSAVVPFGLFVALDDVFIEGLVHISDLGSDYFHFDETRHELAGERTGTRYRLSDRVRVQVIRVDLATTKIDFRLVEAAERPTARVGKTERERGTAPPGGGGGAAPRRGKMRQNSDAAGRAAVRAATVEGADAGGAVRVEASPGKAGKASKPAKGSKGAKAAAGKSGKARKAAASPSTSAARGKKKGSAGAGRVESAAPKRKTKAGRRG